MHIDENGPNCGFLTLCTGIASPLSTHPFTYRRPPRFSGELPSTVPHSVPSPVPFCLSYICSATQARSHAPPFCCPCPLSNPALGHVCCFRTTPVLRPTICCLSHSFPQPHSNRTLSCAQHSSPCCFVCLDGGRESHFWQPNILPNAFECMLTNKNFLIILSLIHIQNTNQHTNQHTFFANMLKVRYLFLPKEYY